MYICFCFIYLISFFWFLECLDCLDCLDCLEYLDTLDNCLENLDLLNISFLVLLYFLVISCKIVLFLGIIYKASPQPLRPISVFTRLNP